MTSTDAPSAKIIDLRRLLAEKFPEAHRATPEPDAFTSGMEALDALGIRRGQAVEVVAPRPSSGSALLLAGVLRHSANAQRWTALVDGADSFDPQSLGNAACRRVLWARCRNGGEVTKAADLLLRDGNLPLVIIDLRLNPVTEVRRIPNHVWHRLRSLAAQTGTVLLAFTPRAVVGCADLRIEVSNTFTLKELDQRETQLRSRLNLTSTRQRQYAHEPPG